MARYIDVDKTICNVINNDKYGTITKQVFVSLLQNAAIANVEPVVYAHKCIARSENGLTMFFECSNCRKAIDYSDVYCRYCGAKMDGDS